MYYIDSQKWLTFLQKDFKNDNQAIFSEWSGWYISISCLTDFVFLKPILNFKGTKNVICLKKKCFAIRRIVLYLIFSVEGSCSDYFWKKSLKFDIFGGFFIVGSKGILSILKQVGWIFSNLGSVQH